MAFGLADNSISETIIRCIMIGVCYNRTTMFIVLCHYGKAIAGVHSIYFNEHQAPLSGHQPLDQANQLGL